MWISEYLTGRQRGGESSVSGAIRSSAGGCVEVSSTGDYKSVPLIAPAGIAYVPASGSRTVILPVSGDKVCLGVIAPYAEGLEAGELMLYSAGGASIVLKNDGRVLINGRAVS